MIELCAADIYPDPKIYLGFTMCLTRDYARIPDRDLVQDCALEHAIDFGKINACVSRDDGYGLSLLRDSVERTQKAGVKYSCTVRVLFFVVFYCQDMHGSGWTRELRVLKRECMS